MNATPNSTDDWPGALDAMTADVKVAGVDRDQCLQQRRLVPHTQRYLYEGDYSPVHLRYHPGARPTLEKVANSLEQASPSAYVESAMQWVRTQVVHAHLLPTPTAVDRAMSEEQLIASGRGWCNEQARVFVALCQVAQIPSRLCFVYHANLRCGHTAAEVFLDQRWGFVDPTFGVRVVLPQQRIAEARDLSWHHRALAHEAYRQPLMDYYARVHPHVDSMPGWNRRDRPDPERGGDLLAHLALCNYVIDGVEPSDPSHLRDDPNGRTSPPSLVNHGG